jgi:hypothetical protein
LSDAVIVVIGVALVVLAFPDLRTVLWLRRVQRRFPSDAIDVYRAAMDVIAFVGVAFAVIGLNSALALMFTDERSLWPPGVGLGLLLVIAFGLKIPGAVLRRRVARLVAAAEAQETYHAGPVMPPESEAGSDG